MFDENKNYELNSPLIEDVVEPEPEPMPDPEPKEKFDDIHYTRYGYNKDGSIRWIERNSAEFVEILGKPDLKNRVAKLIADVDKLADEYLDSMVFYPVNGKTYKPKWADTAGTYWGLLQLDDSLIKREVQSIFPMVIKDATQLPENFVTMTREELENLINYLVLKIQENYNDKTSLIGELREIEKALETCVEYADFEPLYEHYRELQEAFDYREKPELLNATIEKPLYIQKGYASPIDMYLAENVEENKNSDTIEESQEINKNEN